MANLTPKQEAFCLAYIETGNASEAYRRAGYSTNATAKTINEAASRLLADSKISARVASVQQIAAERALVSVLSLTEELEEARALALAEGQPSAAVSASMGKAKLHGLLTDKIDAKVNERRTVIMNFGIQEGAETE